jgi:hypothetical protein
MIKMLIKYALTVVGFGIFAAQASFALTINPKHQKCSISSDCIITNTSCNQFVSAAVAKAFEAHYRKLLDDECKQSTGPSASMSDGPFEAVCEKKKCVLKAIQ